MQLRGGRARRVEERPVVGEDDLIYWIKLPVASHVPPAPARGGPRGASGIRLAALHSALCVVATNSTPGMLIPPSTPHPLQMLVLGLCSVDHDPLTALPSPALMRAAQGGGDLAALAIREAMRRVFSPAADPQRLAPLLDEARQTHAMASLATADCSRGAWFMTHPHTRWFVDAALALHDIVRMELPCAELGARLGRLFGHALPLTSRLKRAPPPSGATPVPHHPEWLQCCDDTPAFHIDTQNGMLQRIFPGGFQTAAQMYIDQCVRKKIL